MFLDNEVFKPFINPNRISRSSVYRKYINKRNYRLDGKTETQKCYAEIQALMRSILSVEIKEAI
jgi:chromosome partitioning protein